MSKPVATLIYTPSPNIELTSDGWPMYLTDKTHCVRQVIFLENTSKDKVERYENNDHNPCIRKAVIIERVYKYQQARASQSQDAQYEGNA